MAVSYKNIVITPFTSNTTNDPKIVFSGANSTVNTDITLKAYPDSNGTISFEGSAGQLFSITNDLTGSIFSVNDVSGLPVIDVNANSYTTISARSLLSNSAPALSITDTWSNASATFTGLKLNVTDTASNAASLLMDLQVGGTSKFKVTKIGDTYLTNIWLPNNGTVGSTGAGLAFSSSNGSYYPLTIRDNTLSVDQSATLAWNSGNSVTGTRDTFIGRAAAATFQLGSADAAAPVAQTLQVQSVVAGTSNTAGVNFTINGSRGTGTGAGGSIIFQVAPAGTTGTAQNALVAALTIASDKSVTVSNPTTAANFTVSGASDGYQTAIFNLKNTTTGKVWYITNNSDDTFSFKHYSGSSYNNIFALTDGGSLTATYLTINGSLAFGNNFGSASFPYDVVLTRDAANTLALRNGTSAQTFRIYNTYTDASNYERGFVRWNTNVFEIGTESAGTGTGRKFRLAVGGAGADADYGITLGNTWYFPSLLQSADSTFGFRNSTQLWPSANGNLRLTNYAGTDFDRLQFGGTTPSFPALKRSGTTLQVRLADDTGDANFSCANATFNGIAPGYAPNRPAFRVYGSGTTNNLSTTQNTNGQLNSNNWAVDYNQGTYLNSSTGVFTAPVAGLYQINVVGRNSGYTSGISQLAVVVNPSGSANVACMLEFAANSSMNHAGVSTVYKLAANDTLVLKVLAGEVNFDTNDNWSVAYIG